MQFWFWNKQAIKEIDECDFASAALTALFDGEASEEEAAHARTHLITCARCAELWAGWNQTRYLFQQAPVMAPPHLLLRILMACRLASRKEAAQNSTLSSGLEREPQAVSDSRFSFDGDLAPPAPPSSLHEEILRRTTRAAAPAPVHVEPRLHHKTPARRLGLNALQFNIRYATATAVPAMLVIMGLVASNSLDAPTSVSPVKEVRATLNAGISTSAGQTAEKGRRVLAAVMPRESRLQPALALGAQERSRNRNEGPRAETAMETQNEREHGLEVRRSAPRDFEPADAESHIDRRAVVEEAVIQPQSRQAAVRETQPAAAAPDRRMATHRVSPPSGGVQFASLPLPQASRFEREVAALPPVANVTQTVTRLAPTAMMLVQRMASSRSSENLTATNRTGARRSARSMRTRAALTTMPMPVTTQLAGFRSSSSSTSFNRRDSDNLAADAADGWAGDSDLRDNRPEAVKSVIENFRAALDQDDADLPATEG